MSDPKSPLLPRDARARTGPLWFLAEPDAFLRRFVMRTLLEPPRSRRFLGPRRRPPGR